MVSYISISVKPNEEAYNISLCFSLRSQEDAITFADHVGYPCLLRPSYVLR